MKKGDVVIKEYLMTIEDIKGNNIKCIWFEGENFKRGTFKKNTLGIITTFVFFKRGQNFYPYLYTCGRL